MNEEEFKECSVIAYPHEIRFLHIKGGHISYYVDRHISDYINKLQEENQRLKEKIDKVFQLLQLLHYKFEDNDVIHNEIEDIQKILKE